MKHQLYKKQPKSKKTKKGTYPKLYREATGPGRKETRKRWSMAGRMSSTGKFFGGVKPKALAGEFLMNRYLSGRNMASFPSWFGWKKSSTISAASGGKDEYRERMKAARGRSWWYDKRTVRHPAPVRKASV